MMSRTQLFLIGLMLGMAAIGFCWGLWQVDGNLKQQIAYELRLQAQQ